MFSLAARSQGHGRLSPHRLCDARARIAGCRADADVHASQTDPIHKFKLKFALRTVYTAVYGIARDIHR
jgi:hypothetical protein